MSENLMPTLEDLKKQQDELMKKAEEIKAERKRDVSAKADKSEEIFRGGIKLEATKDEAEKNLEIYANLEEDNLLDDSGKKTFEDTKTVVDGISENLGEQRKMAEGIFNDPDVEIEIATRAERQNDSINEREREEEKKKEIKEKMKYWMTEQLFPALKRGEELNNQYQVAKGVFLVKTKRFEDLVNLTVKDERNKHILLQVSNSPRHIKGELASMKESAGRFAFLKKMQLNKLLESSELSELGLAWNECEELLKNVKAGEANIYGFSYGAIKEDPSIIENLIKIQKEAWERPNFVVFQPDQEIEGIEDSSFDKHLLKRVGSFIESELRYIENKK